MTALRIGLIGLGTVGTEVARGLIEDAPLLAGRAGRALRLAGVAVRDTGRRRGVDLGDVVVSGDAVMLVEAQSVDVVVEVMGGVATTLPLLRRALTAGKSVVTANKQLIAAHGQELHLLARAHGCQLRFSAAVGGGTPILELLTGSLRGDPLTEIAGVLNGTTNLMLEMMAEGMSFRDAVADAQARGFAETDPSEDVDGLDAAAKIAICAALAWHCAVDRDNVATIGIREVDPVDLAHAAALGCTVKLLARAVSAEGTLALTVAPTVIPLSGNTLSALAQLGGAGNGVVVLSKRNGPVTVLGSGAGGRPTSSAVLSDVVAIASGEPMAQWGADAVIHASAEERESGAYLRLQVSDPGAADVIAQQLEDRGVSVEATVSGVDELVVLTRPATEAVLDRAVETIETLPAVVAVAARLAYVGAG